MNIKKLWLKTLRRRCGSKKHVVRGKWISTLKKGKGKNIQHSDMDNQGLGTIRLFLVQKEIHSLFLSLFPNVLKNKENDRNVLFLKYNVDIIWIVLLFKEISSRIVKECVYKTQRKELKNHPRTQWSSQVTLPPLSTSLSTFGTPLIHIMLDSFKPYPSYYVG